MYSRAKPAAHRPRADNVNLNVNGHLPNRAPSESRPRGPAAAPTPAALVSRSAPDHAPTPASGSGTAVGPGRPDHAAAAAPVRSTLLQPRVAVALGVSKKWYPILFLCRLVSIVPGVLFGLPNALRLLATLHLMYLDRVLDGGALSKLGRGGATSSPTSGYDLAFEARLRLTEALLATIWVRYTPALPRTCQHTHSCSDLTLTLPPSAVLRLRLPLLLLHRLPHVALAAALHPASDHRPAAHRRRHQRLPHLLGPPPDRRLRRPAVDPSRMDRHIHCASQTQTPLSSLSPFHSPNNRNADTLAPSLAQHHRH